MKLFGKNSGKKDTWRGISDADYDYIGTTRDKIEPWEDGVRSTDKPASYEWWYFDVVTEEGLSVVVVFHKHDLYRFGKTPKVTLEITYPDGNTLETIYLEETKNYRFSKEFCDVQIGLNTAKGDLDTYNVHYEYGDIILDIELKAIVPAWRPGTGYIFYNRKRRDYFSWIPAIPKGQAKLTLQNMGEVNHYTGFGYHDHNWGNAPAPFLLHHWYWARATIGDYTVINSVVTSSKKYNYKQHISLFLAKDDKMIGSQITHKVHFEAREPYIDEKSGKPSHNVLIYYLEDGNTVYKITLNREKDISNVSMIEELSGGKKTFSKLIGFNGTYIRFEGTVSLEKFESDVLVETVKSNAVWELMYLGDVIEDMKYFE